MFRVYINSICMTFWKFAFSISCRTYFAIFAGSKYKFPVTAGSYIKAIRILGTNAYPMKSINNILNRPEMIFT